MTGLAIAAAILIAVYGAIRWFARTPPKRIISDGKTALGLALLAAAVLFGITGRVGLAAPLAMAGVSLIGAGGVPMLGRRTARTGGSRSTVRSAVLEMVLDHDTGTMEGRVLSGNLAGRALRELDRGTLLALHRALAGDGESRALLEAYLDRRAPGWREDVEADARARHAGAPDAGAMGDEEAYQILGLAEGAGEAEIRAAHRRLMKGVHPDQGGSTYLAARINAAKERLLQNHR